MLSREAVVGPGGVQGGEEVVAMEGAGGHTASGKLVLEVSVHNQTAMPTLRPELNPVSSAVQCVILTHDELLSKLSPLCPYIPKAIHL